MVRMSSRSAPSSINFNRRIFYNTNKKENLRHLANVGGQVVQLKAVAYLDVPARLLSNQSTVHLGGLVVLSLRSTRREDLQNEVLDKNLRITQG
jgi:hypothetical protein